MIVAGGLATRLGELSECTPKSMIMVAGKPFLEHQIRLLALGGIYDIVLCIGHFGQRIREVFGDGHRYGVTIRYSDEGTSPIGTGGALRKAAPLLKDPFMLMWGDSYLLLDYSDVWKSLNDPTLDGVMVVYRNENRHVQSNVAIDHDRVVVYDKSKMGFHYVDNGLSVLRKRVLERVPLVEPFAIEKVFGELAAEGRLGAYETTQRFYEIGSPQGVSELEAFLSKQ